MSLTTEMEMARIAETWMSCQAQVRHDKSRQGQSSSLSPTGLIKITITSTYNVRELVGEDEEIEFLVAFPGRGAHVDPDLLFR